jgi:hypothetical protein
MWWLLLVGFGGVSTAVAFGRRRPGQPSDVAVAARIAAIEEHVRRVNQLSESLAIRINSVPDVQLLREIIQQSVLVALKEFKPRTPTGTSDMARALDVIRDLSGPKEERKRPWVDRAKPYLGIAGVAIGLLGSTIGILGKTGLWHASAPPEIASFTADSPRARAGRPLLLRVDARDKEGEALHFSYRASFGLVEADGPMARWTVPAEPARKLALLTVTVSNGHLSAERDLSVPINSPPQARLILPPRVRAGERASLRVEASDEDGDQLHWAWRVDDGQLERSEAREVEWRAPTTTRTVAVSCDVDDGTETTTSTGAIEVTAKH